MTGDVTAEGINRTIWTERAVGDPSQNALYIRRSAVPIRCVAMQRFEGCR